MARIAILVFIVAVNAVLSSQPDEIYEYGTKIGPSHNYYPNDTLNLVTLGVVNGKKYFFASGQQAWATWYQASYFCNAHGMDLASIETQHENYLIIEHIAKIDYGPETYWISGHKNGRSSWLWINGDYIVISGWVPYDTSDPAKDHCLSIAGGELKGRRCEMQTGSGFICEERETLEESLNERSIYPNSTLNLVTLGIVNGKKYFFASQRQSWESWYQASYFCNAHGMDLASIETQHENELIMEQISKLGFTSETYWISGHKNGRSSWLWINGDFIIFSDWGAGEPSDPETDHCLSINNGSWYDRLCELETGAGFICEERETFEEIEQRSIYASDTLDLVTLDSTTGQKYFFATATASWFEASYFCNAYGMDLVTIETQKENDLIVAHIESIGVTPAMTYWTSAHTIGRSTWLWINGEIVIYADWADQQPQNPDVNSCMFISGGDWYNDRCEIGNMEAFICESRQLASERSIDIAAEITYYPADLMNLVTLGPGAGKQYLTSNQAATWFEASYFCNAHGMDLVSIETEEENAAIMSHITSIGHGTSYNFASGHKIGRTTYLWINGEYMQYADWAPGQPIDPEFQSCLIVSSNDWYGRVCYYDSYFICEERTIQSNSK